MPGTHGAWNSVTCDGADDGGINRDLRAMPKRQPVADDLDATRVVDTHACAMVAVLNLNIRHCRGIAGSCDFPAEGSQHEMYFSGFYACMGSPRRCFAR